MALIQAAAEVAALDMNETDRMEVTALMKEPRAPFRWVRLRRGPATSSTSNSTGPSCSSPRYSPLDGDPGAHLTECPAPALLASQLDRSYCDRSAAD